MPKTPISFTKSVAAGATETGTKTLQQDGRVTRIFVPTYPGQELALQYRITIETVEGVSQPLTDPTGDDYLAGNGEVFDLEIDREVRKGDTVQIQVENTDGTYDYTANAWVGVDYDPSVQSLLAALVPGRTRSDDTGGSAWGALLGGAD